MTEEKHYRLTFYLTINSLFILLTLIVGGILTWHNYRATEKIVLASANHMYDQVVREVSQDFQHTYKPVFQTVHLLSMTPVMQAMNLDKRLHELQVLSTALKNKAELSAIQVGYENGDYFIIRSVATERLRSLFQAPENTEYVVDNISTDSVNGQRLLLRLYFDEQLYELLRQEPQATEYDPRLRPWYIQANATDHVSAVSPYLFYFMQEIGTTVSYKPYGTEAVIAADVTLRQLSTTLSKHLITPQSEIAMVDSEELVLAYNQPEKMIIRQDDEQFRMANLSELKSGILEYLHTNKLVQPGPLKIKYKGEVWLGDIRTLNVSGIKGRDLTLIMLSPSSELLANAIQMVKRSLMVTLVILLLSIPASSLLAVRISNPLKGLAKEADLVSRFDFSKPVTVQTRIKEVDDLARSMELMKTTISRFLVLIKSLAREQNFDAMLELITSETMNTSQAGGVITFLVDEEKNTLNPVALFEQSQGGIDIRGVPVLSLDSQSEIVKAVNSGDIRHIHLEKEQAEEMGGLLDMFAAGELMVTALPLQNRQEEVIGLLCLLNTVKHDKTEVKPWESRLDFVRTFSGFAAVSLESRHLLEMQKRLMDSFMHLLAGAIDAKSPYTGGHCQRVPVLTKMLAKAACEDTALFRDYQLDDDGWEAIHLAGWLHDCGKVTTPEYVVDKATKLETIYDRIHEIRTRFEVLKRDAEIRYWQQVAGGGDRDSLRESLQKEIQGIDEDFAFIAECNVGGEFMAPEKIERLDAIAERTWTRTLDDRIGISWDEEKRKGRVEPPALPVTEHILADRMDHLIERNENERMPEDNQWGFKLDVPEYRYNLGEIYNLKVARGTLTAEERYKINDHMVQTITMLEKLPYPKHLRVVPELAGGHHETMDGKGYPKRLTGDQMSVTAKMMAIADIFEALTASDRPYKKAKKLSEAIRIMSFFKKDHHIDPDLFDLFLRSGVYLEYARQYLDPEHIDEVDIEQYLG